MYIDGTKNIQKQKSIISCKCNLVYAWDIQNVFILNLHQNCIIMYSCFVPHFVESKLKKNTPLILNKGRSKSSSTLKSIYLTEIVLPRKKSIEVEQFQYELGYQIHTTLSVALIKLNHL